MLRGLIAGVVIAAVVSAPSLASAQVAEHAETLVVAHRGGSAYAPENTMLAFENATRLGVDAIELDVMFSADNELVVIHDDTLERTTSCEGVVSEQTLEDLAICDAAFWFSPGQPVTVPDEALDHPLRGSGIGIPTLREVFAWARSLGDEAPTLFVEVKAIPGEANFEPVGTDYAQAVIDLATEHGLRERIVVLAFWPLVIDEVKRLDPGIRTKLLTTSELGIVASMGLTYAIARGHEIVGPNYSAPDFTNAFVAAAHAAGKQVSTWTVNEPEDIDVVLAIGPDAVTSDFPSCVLLHQGRDAPRSQVPQEVADAGGGDTPPCPDGSDPRPLDEPSPQPAQEVEEAQATGQPQPLPATGAVNAVGALAIAMLTIAVLAFAAISRPPQRLPRG